MLVFWLSFPCLTLGLSLKRSIIFFTYKIKSMPWLLQGSKDIIDIKRQALHPADNVGVVFFFFPLSFFNLFTPSPILLQSPNKVSKTNQITGLIRKSGNFKCSLGSPTSSYWHLKSLIYYFGALVFSFIEWVSFTSSSLKHSSVPIFHELRRLPYQEVRCC